MSPSWLAKDLYTPSGAVVRAGGEGQVFEEGERTGELILAPKRDCQTIIRRTPTQTFTGSSVRDVLTHHIGDWGGI